MNIPVFVTCMFIAIIRVEIMAYPCIWRDDRAPSGRALNKECDTSTFLTYDISCDNYIDFEMDPCKRKIWSGYADGFYDYRINIYVERARQDNLFIKNIESYDKVVVKTLSITNSDLYKIPSDVFQLKRLQNLEAPDNHIKEITMSDFLNITDLKTIDLSRNKICVIKTTDIDHHFNISRQSKVERLLLNNNRITNISDNFLINFEHLNYLDLSNNEISFISRLAFNGSLNLRRFYLSGNRLLNIDDSLDNLRYLYYLNVAHNLLTAISAKSFAHKFSLSILDLSYNHIKAIEDHAFSELYELSRLYLNNNNLTEISKQMFRHNSLLCNLSLNDNPLTYIDNDCLENSDISEFRINNHKLTKIGSIVLGKSYEYGGRETVDLSDGLITHIGNDVFNGTVRVRSINMSSNAIHHISNFAFNNTKQLAILDLSHNKLKDIDFITDNLTKLSELYIHHNNVEKILKTVFDNFISLRKLDVSFNNIKEIEPMSVANMKLLSFINLKCNSVDIMKNVIFNNMHILDEIEMSKTENSIIKNGSFVHNEFIERINSAFSNIQDIEYNAFIGIDHLYYLNLSCNRIESFNVNTSTLMTIKELYLDNNKIKNISRDMFYNLNYLTILNLANNDILYIETNAFTDLTALKYLDISSNIKPRPPVRISDLPKTIETLSVGNFNLDISFENSSSSIKVLKLQSCGIKDLSKLYLSNIRDLNRFDLIANDISAYDDNTVERRNLARDSDL